MNELQLSCKPETIVNAMTSKLNTWEASQMLWFKLIVNCANRLLIRLLKDFSITVIANQLTKLIAHKSWIYPIYYYTDCLEWIRYLKNCVANASNTHFPPFYILLSLSHLVRIWPRQSFNCLTLWTKLNHNLEGSKNVYNFYSRMGLRWARLRNWRIGRTYPLRPQSRVIQWLLSAQWYNWSWEDRYDITRDVEASNVVWLTPTRLGVNLRFSCLVHGDKRHANIFIGLYDRRIITPELFRVQTYKSWFQDFARNIDDEG